MTGAAFGQRYSFASFTIADGLPNDRIFSILQDTKGKLWIGTAKGACRFDGQQFQAAGPDSDKATELLSRNPVRVVFQDHAGTIWLGMTKEGLCRFDGDTYTVYTTKNGLANNNVSAIGEDARGRVWIGTQGGLSLVADTGFVTYTETDGLVNNFVLDIRSGPDSTLWLATPGGVSRFDGKRFTNYTVADGLAGNLVYAVLPDRRGRCWAGTAGGLSLIDGQAITTPAWAAPLGRTRVQKVAMDERDKLWIATFGQGVWVVSADSVLYRFTTQNGLSSNNVFSTLQDTEGNFWFGTDRGLTRYRGRRFETFTVDDGLANSFITSVYHDAERHTWFGTANGLSCYDGTAFRSFAFVEPLRDMTIWDIDRDSQDDIWLGTTRGLGRIRLRDSSLTFPFSYFNEKNIFDVLVTRDNRLFLATNHGVFHRDSIIIQTIDSMHGLFDEQARVLYEDAKGRIWIGTVSGAYYLDGDSAISFNAEFDLDPAPVTSITGDVAGHVIIGTYAYGLFVYDGRKVARYTEKNGLKDNRIQLAFLDRNLYLWLSTPAGLDVVRWPEFLEKPTTPFTHFGRNNGYYGNECRSAASDSAGNVWFATVNGAVRFNQQEGIVRAVTPNIWIDKIQLFQRDVTWTDYADSIDATTKLPENLVLKHNSNHLTFHVSAIYLAAPEELMYMYFLEGFDKEWSPPTRVPLANYSNLPPGNYMFKVKASADHVNWTPRPVLFGFTILKPVWKTPLFYALYALVAAGLILLFIQLRTRSLRQAQLVLQNKVELRTLELNEKNVELEKLSLVASETDNAVMIFNGEKELEWVNVGFTKQTGYTLDEIVARRGPTIYEISSNPVIRDIVNECVDKKTSASYESVMETKSGRNIWLSSTLNPIYRRDGRLINLVVVDTDISYRKEMEEQIKQSLEEKGLLLKEIHHRVKNNLQIIISLFNLQSGFVDDDKAYKALREGQDRIKAMALIHERFYQAQGTTRIDFDDYIRRLCDNLLVSHNIVTGKIRIDYDLDKISLDIDSAVPCGLIINELATNAIRHAFPGDAGGTLAIGFRRTDGGTFRLTVSDDGVGLAQGFDLLRADTLGMQLVAALTDQLEGRVRVARANGRGTGFVVEFRKA